MKPAFAPGLMVAGRADPARLVPAITLSRTGQPSARQQAAINFARWLAVRAYQEHAKCA
jgi:hypothetical protein